MAMMSDEVVEQKSASRQASCPASVGEGMDTPSKWQDTIAELKYTFLTRDGWFGDYV